MNSTKSDERGDSGSEVPTLYSILGVPHDATPATITKSYRAKALTLHPDRIATADRTSKPSTASSGGVHHKSPTTHGPTTVGEHVVFAQVTEAYQTLVDPERRSQYDAALSAAANAHNINTSINVSSNRVPRPDSSHVPDFLLGRLSNSRGGGGDQHPSTVPPRAITPIESMVSVVGGEGHNSRGTLYRSAISSSSGTRPPLNRHQVPSTPLEGSRRVQTPLSPPGSAPFDDLPANMHKRWDQQFKVGKGGKVERRRTNSNAPPLPMSASGGPRSNSAASVDQLTASQRDMASRGSGEGLGMSSIHGVGSFGASFFKGFTTCAPVDDDLDEANAFPAPTFRPRPGESVGKRGKGASTPQRMLPFRPPSQTDIVPDRDEESLFGTLIDSSTILQVSASYASGGVRGGGGVYGSLMVGGNRDGGTPLPQRLSPTGGRLLKRSHLFSPPHHQQQRGGGGPSSPSPTRSASPERATPLPYIGGVGVRDRSNLGPLNASAPVFKGAHRMLPNAENGGPQIRRGNPSITKPHLGRVRELAVVSSIGRLHQLETEVINGKSEREETKKRIAIRQLKQRELYVRAREETSRSRREAGRLATEGVETSQARGHVVFTLEDGTKVSDFSRSNATTMTQVPQMTNTTSTATGGGSSPHRSINRSTFVASVVEEADAALAALRNRSARMKGVAGSTYSQLARDRAQKVVTAAQFRQPQLLANADIPQRHLHPLEREHKENWARLQARAKTVNTFFGDATGAY